MTRIAISYRDLDNNAKKVLGETVSQLETWADVDLLDPEETHPHQLGDGDYDVYHAAVCRRQSLRDQKTAADTGIPTVNSVPGTRTTVDRLETLRYLRQLGIPTPPFQHGPADEITLDAPLVVKPRKELGPDRHDIRFYDPGRNGEGPISFGHDTLDHVDDRVVEAYIDTERHLKAYQVGAEVRAVELDDPLAWDGEELSSPQPRIEEVVRRIGDGLDLHVFEADIVPRDGTPYVVDVNPTVNLSGVDGGVNLYEQAVREASENGYHV